LPLRKLVDLLNSQALNNGLSDVRHLLVDDEWPEGYYDDRLAEVSEKIMLEWQQLRGDKFYSNHFNVKSNRNKDILRLRALEFVFECYKFGFKEYAVEVIQAFKFKGITELNDITRKHQQIIQKLDIEKEEESGEFKIYIFEDLITPIEEEFKITVDYNITVAKFESWNKRLKAKRNG